MEQYRTNQITSKKDKFALIEKHFINLANNTPQKKIIKFKSHLDFQKRPVLKKKNKFYIHRENGRNPLDQIGNDDLIFNNDKLITNIKIDTIDDDLDSIDISNENDKNDYINNRKQRNRKRSLTPVKGMKKIVPKITLAKNNNNTLELYCNKNTYNNKMNEKNNTKNYKNRNNNQSSTRLKHINQFINKPNDKKINELKNNLMTPTSNRTKPKMHYNNSFTKLNRLKLSQSNNHNDSISLASASRMGARTCIRGKSMPSSRKKSNMHFPSKSIIKNKEKLLAELQKLFGDKLVLYDEIYQNFTDSDKRNCINFLLESVKELYTFYKVAQSKTEAYKDINENKDRQIKDNKNEIKELKKEIMKLNKIIKTNIQVNRKLSQNIDSLKLQLEKEKNKNKAFQIRGKSTSRNDNNLKYKNETNEFSMTATKRGRFNSQERFRKSNESLNIKKKNNNSSLDNNKDKDKINKNKINIYNIQNDEKDNKEILINSNIENNLKEENLKNE